MWPFSKQFLQKYKRWLPYFRFERHINPKKLYYEDVNLFIMSAVWLKSIRLPRYMHNLNNNCFNQHNVA